MLPCAIKSATCGSIFDPARIRRELAEIETKLADPALWSNPNATKPLMREKKRLEVMVADDEGLMRRTGDIEAYFELAKEGEDVLVELDREIKALEGFAEDLEARTMLNGEADALNAIVTVHPGAGGTESQDWAEMLLRMYLRWAEQQGFKTEMNDYQDGEEAGIKSATFTIMGEYAFGQLAGESGVHRLVRISPFDSAKRRHTSFASVYVSPEIDETIHVDLKVEDLRIDTYRSGGKGGQHVNTTDSAVRMTHLPTGIVVCCQNERSPAQEPRQGDEDAAVAALRIRVGKEARGEQEAGRLEAGDQLRLADPVVCFAAVSHGQGPSHQGRGGRRRQGAGRLPGAIFARLSAGQAAGHSRNRRAGRRSGRVKTGVEIRDQGSESPYLSMCFYPVD
jgi:peptide chain release factor 2